MGSKLPEELTRFLQSSVPTLDALKILLFLVSRKAMPCSPGDIVDALAAMPVAEPEVRTYLALLLSQGVVTESLGDGYAYSPNSMEIELVIGSLVRAYNERPVTLIRTVYGIGDSKSVQSIDGAFRSRKNP